MAGVAGLEPTHARVKVWCLTDLAIPLGKYGVDEGTRTLDNQNHNLALYQLNYVHHEMARQQGFEPRAHGLEGRCSIQLSYWR